MTLKPTMELRWYRYNTKYILQQKWIDELGNEQWIDIEYHN